MLETPRLTQTPAQAIAVIRVTVPRDQIQTVMGPGLSELKATVAAQGLATLGPWFTHHLKITPDTFDFEIGVPVAAPVAPAGRVTPGERPAMKVAQAVSAPDLWEVYVAGPESSPDPATWRTELNRPLQVGPISQ